MSEPGAVIAATIDEVCGHSNGALAPSSPHKTGEVLGDSFVSGDPVNGLMHGLVVVIARMTNHAINTQATPLLLLPLLEAVQFQLLNIISTTILLL